ncbi:MAG: hypothetical protein K0S41_333 [Anaerocolumna sp.]|jgi:hypothetical protein|nr:hypothetical protein [Anaerocolumna sp.]
MYLNQFIKKVVFTIVLIALFTHPATAYAADAPYTTLTIDKDGYFVNTQDGYTPLTVLDKFGEEKLKNPSDLFITKDGKMYIADTGNKRVLICDKKGNLLFTIEDELKGPTGLYVDEEGTIYVADPKLKKILVYSEQGVLIKTYETPVSPLFAPNDRYAPSKLVVNSAGSIYSISEGNANGILTFSSVGDFYGYFGANNTSISFTQILRRLAFTEEMKNSLQQNVPAASLNLDIDANGLIYTVTQGSLSDGLKKFNMAGKNMLSNGYVDDLVVDVAVGDIENIYTVSAQGFICEYTREQELLFMFGGKDDGNNRTGLFVSPTAIEVDNDGKLYILDSELANITVLEQTEYATTVHKALYLFQEGFYIESHEPWQEVLRKNSLFDYARRGIGKAFYRLEKYDLALESARLGGDYKGYSDAFWELRNTWIREHIINIFFGLILLSIIWRIVRKIKDKAPGIKSITRGIRVIRNKKLMKELAFLNYMPKNPADAFYGIKFEGKVSIVSSTILYVLFFIIYVINKYYSGFLFKTVEDGFYEIGTDFIFVFGLLALFLICNNLICSIKDGEGSFKNIYCSVAYCLMPYIMLKPIVILLSHVLTFNESFIISFFNFFIFAAIAIFIIIMIKEIQAYTVKETFRSIFLTAFTMIILLAAGFILFALIKQVMDFVVSIFKEVYYRGK